MKKKIAQKNCTEVEKGNTNLFDFSLKKTRQKTRAAQLPHGMQTACQTVVPTIVNKIIGYPPLLK